MKVSSISPGRINTVQPGSWAYQIIRPRYTTKLRAQSTSPAPTQAVGTNSRGKYILVSRWAWFTRLTPAWVTALAKNIQGSSPA